MPEQRTPPRWFDRLLKALNPRFTAVWIESRKQWAINEDVRWMTYQGRHDGAAVYRIGRRPVRGIYVEELGSRVIDLLKSRDPRRYRTLEGVIEGMGIDKTHNEHRPAAELLT